MQKKSPLPGLEPTPDVIWSTDAGEKQAARRSAGLELASILADGPVSFVNTEDGPGIVNEETGELLEDRAAAFAALIAFGADPSNHVAGILDGRDGATFYGGSALWKPSLRLDPNWMETMRRRSRNRAHAALGKMLKGLSRDEKLARKYGWRQRLTLKLITLTMPHHAGTFSLDETRRLNRALELLKKRQLWRETMAGGVKGVEDALTADGPHVHAHLLMLSRYFQKADLAEAWRECLSQATMEAYGFGLAEDCLPFIDVRQVRTRKVKKPGEEITWEDALSEVTKYVTKPSDFIQPDASGRKIPREVLIELCEVRRWPRMFELLGRCRNEKVEHGQAASAALDSIRRAYSTGTLPTIPKSVGWELVEGWDLEADGPAEMLQLATAALRMREKKPPRIIRPPSWRDLLDQISLSEWLGVMAERFRRGKAYRMRQILGMNPSAHLVSMNGHTFACSATA